MAGISTRRRRPRNARAVRYAVVGLGHIAQNAVLPAFSHARRNSRLAAFVSDDPEKRRRLARRYRVEKTYSYDEYGDCLSSGEIDAVYIALPNFLHRDYAVAAAWTGLHVLCEKPLAVTEEECEDMLSAAKRGGVRLMTAYRLHFDAANLEAVRLAHSGQIGEPRLFESVFTMQVEKGNVRLESEAKGGGPFYDIGIYCINAARYLFRGEPEEVFAVRATSGEKRFGDVEETASAILRFPGDRLAAFTCSFGAGAAGWYQLIGTRGDLRLDPAYEYAKPLRLEWTAGGKTRRRTFARRDQFAAELLAFSDGILGGRDPEPSGREGLADVRIIRALLRSADDGRPVRMPPFERSRRPRPAQAIRRPAVPRAPELVNVHAPSA